MTVYMCIIYKFRIFDIGEAERLKTKQLMMILISKQISNSHSIPVSDCRQVWPGWARGFVTISLSVSANLWNLLSNGSGGLTSDQCPAPPGVSCHTGDQWHVLTIDWAPWARDTPLTSTGHPWHVPRAADHSLSLTTALLSLVTAICCPPPCLWCHPLAPPLPHCDANKASLWLPALCLGLECRWSVLKWNTQKRKTEMEIELIID